MGKILTVVAVRPDTTVFDESQQPNGEQDAVIDSVMVELRKRNNAATHIVRRAHTLEKLAKTLKEVKDQGIETIQLIGHGRRGELLLGASWSPTDPKVTYILDSNPHWYEILFDDLPPTVTEIRLLGCNVGAADPGPTTIADGPALLFDLARMWPGSVVSGPKILVSAADFGADGLYLHPTKLVRAQGLSVTDPAIPPPPSPPIETSGQRIKFIKLLAAPALRFVKIKEPGTVINHPTFQALSQRDFDKVRPGPLLAAPELTFAATWNNQQWTAEIIGNSRLVRLRSATDPVHYFEIGLVAREDLRRLVSDIVIPI